MFIVHVFVSVKPDQIDAFKAATVENAQNSVREPGIARFDVVHQMDDPARFVLVEVYRQPEDAGLHKETDHYKKWRDTVADMVAEPRSSIKYDNVFPDGDDTDPSTTGWSGTWTANGATTGSDFGDLSLIVGKNDNPNRTAPANLFLDTGGSCPTCTGGEAILTFSYRRAAFTPRSITPVTKSSASKEIRPEPQRPFGAVSPMTR